MLHGVTSPDGDRNEQHIDPAGQSAVSEVTFGSFKQGKNLSIGYYFCTWLSQLWMKAVHSLAPV